MTDFLGTRLTWLAALLLAFCVVRKPVAGLIAARVDWPNRWASSPFRTDFALKPFGVARNLKGLTQKLRMQGDQ